MKSIQIKIIIAFLLFNIIYNDSNEIMKFKNSFIKQELNDNKKISEFELFNNNILYNNKKYFEKENKYIFKDSLNDKNILKNYISNSLASDSNYTDYKVNVFFHNNSNEYLNEFLKPYKTDSGSFFMKIFSHSEPFGFNNIYYHNIKEKYYLYFKKYFGNVDFYQYNDKLSASYDYNQFKKPIISYEDPKQYQLKNNELITVNGYQLFSFFNTYNSLYQMYLQKDDDNDIIDNELSLFKNVVKLLIKDKTYTFVFRINHLIRLDDNFKDTEVKFIDENGKKYILNKSNKIINIKAKNLTVTASKDNALIYCYTNYSEYRSDPFKIIEFDKSKTGKIMKFTIEYKSSYESIIKIAKDFGFEGYCPILNYQSFDQILASKNDTFTVYIENLYDKLEDNLYDDKNFKEKYFIYVFERYDEQGIPFYNDEALSLGEPEYIDNLLTKGNNYNFEIIPGNSNGGIVLNSLSKNHVNYQFFKCSNDKINFEISSSNEFHNEEINEDKDISRIVNTKEILMHSFKSEHEFLFVYSFNDEKKAISMDKASELKINNIKFKKKNKISIEFNSNYIKTLTRYFIIIGPKNKENTENNFSDPCFIAKLILHNPKGIKIEIFLDLGDKETITKEVDISEISSKNKEFMINIVSQELKYEKLQFYNPKNFNKEDNDDDDDDDNDYKNFFIALGCIFGSLFLIIFIIVIIFFIKKKSQEKLLEQVNQISFAEDRENNNDYLNPTLD